METLEQIKSCIEEVYAHSLKTVHSTMKRFILSLVCLAIVGFNAIAVPSKQQWPQWRGNGLGVSADTKVPLDWSTTNGVLWRTALPGRGHSSPVILDGRIYLTTDIEGEAISGA